MCGGCWFPSSLEINSKTQLGHFPQILLITVEADDKFEMESVSDDEEETADLGLESTHGNTAPVNQQQQLGGRNKSSRTTSYPVGNNINYSNYNNNSNNNNNSDDAAYTMRDTISGVSRSRLELNLINNIFSKSLFAYCCHHLNN